MSKIQVIAKREYFASVRTKAFMLSLVMMPIFMGGGVMLQDMLAGRVDMETKKLLVFDRTGVLFPHLQKDVEWHNEHDIFDQKTKRQMDPKFVLELGSNDPLTDEMRFTLSERIRKHDIHAFAEIEKSVLQDGKHDEDNAEVSFFSESVISNDLSRWFQRTISREINGQRLRQAGIDPTIVQKATVPIEVDVLGLYTRTKGGEIKKADESSRKAALFVPLGIMMLMFMSLMLSQTLLHNTIEEKQQKIAEVLLGSVSPFQIMMGKLLGSVAVSLTVVCLYFAGGYWMLNRGGYAQLLPTNLIAWFLIFQVMGVVIFGSVFAAIGAACNELKEAQSYLMPVMLVLVFPMMVWFKVIEEPMSSFATWLSFFPSCTPMLMMLRMSATGAVPMWQPILGIGTMLISSIVCVWLAGRIFRVGLLMQGKAPKLTDLVKYAIRG